LNTTVRYDEILKKLARFENKRLLAELAWGGQIVAITSMLLFTFFAFLEYLFFFSPGVRSVFYYTWLGITCGSIVHFVLTPLYRRYFIVAANPVRSALEAGSYFPQVKDDLMNVMQLVKVSDRRGFSEKLVVAAFDDIYDRIKELEFGSAVSFKKAKKLLIFTLISFILSGGSFTFSSGMKDAGLRIIDHNKQFVPPQKYSFEIKPGDIEVAKGDSVMISVIVSGPAAKSLELYHKDDSQPAFIKEVIKAGKDGSFSFIIPSVKYSTEYYAAIEDSKSITYKLTVTDKPLIRAFKLQITPPSYTGERPTEQTDNGNVSGIKGTVISLSLESNKELSEASIEFMEGINIPLTVDGTSATGLFRIMGDNEYVIKITDTKGYTNISPVKYTIRASYDASPEIVVLSPDSNTALPRSQRQDISLMISDDFGFSGLNLNYKISKSKDTKTVQEKFTAIPVPFNKSVKETQTSYNWSLAQLFLSPGDEVTYYLEVFDNDQVSGPKSAKSREYIVRVPTLDELFATGEQKQDEIQKELTEVLKEADELQKDLEKVSKELKSDKKELTFEEKEKLEKMLDKFEKLQEKAEQLSQKMEDAQENMKENNLLSPQTMEKYQELQKMLQDISTDEMKKLMEKMAKNLESLNRKDAQQNLENMKMDEEAFKKSIERTLNLLKRVQIEQKIDELVKRVEQLNDQLEKLQKETQNADPKGMEELAKKQDEVKDQMKDLEKEMQDLRDKMKDMKDMPNEQAEKLQNELEKQKNEELSEEAKKNMKKGQKQQAMQNQQQMSKNMKEMKEGLEELQNSINQSNQMQTMADMMKIISDIVDLSKQQENLKKKTQNSSPSALLSQEMREQDKIQRNLEKMLSRLGDLAQKTFAVSPEMAKSLGDARREMNKSLENMQNRNNKQAAGNQGQAMASLNQAAGMMQDAMAQMMQQGNGGQGGMMSMMQQMGQMAGQQMSLNQQVQEMMKGNNGKMSQEQMGQMQRLQQQQEVIKKSLDQLNKETKAAGKSKSIPANLDKLSQEMQEIITDMRTGKYNDDLVKKQDKILSKLLDATKSINERDFEKERESFTGTNIKKNSPGAFNTDGGKKERNYSDNINKALQGGFTKDYEDLTRKYYNLIK
jgi:hypothetical protein